MKLTRLHFFHGILVFAFLCGASCQNRESAGIASHAAQADVSRMTDSLESLVWHYYLACPDSAEIIQNQTIRELDSLHQPQHKIHACLRLAEFYQYRKPDYLKAIKNLVEAVGIFSASPGRYRTNPYFFVDIGNLFYHSRKYLQARIFIISPIKRRCRTVTFMHRPLPGKT